MALVLIVDDEERICRLWGNILEEEGHEVLTAGDGESALQLARDGELDVVLLDLRLPGMDGIAVLEKLKGIQPRAEVVMMTAHASVKSAVEAMKAGAADYVTKPLKTDDLVMKVERAAERALLKEENRQLRSELSAITGIENVAGSSAAIRNAVREATRAAPLKIPVLLRGESGTGKTLFARIIHQNSPRANRPLIEVNCAALPDNLLENELFGHEREAFTGALSRRKGKVELTSGGTLLLDEIGDMSLALQAKLLRVIEERSFFRLGGEKEVKCDCRFILATNADLNEKLREGTFRWDLYYRISVFSVYLPPLRRHIEDLPPLMEHILSGMSKQGLSISAEVMKLFESYSWPGNVRELQNVLQSAVIRCDGDVVKPEHLPPYIDWHGAPTSGEEVTLEATEENMVRNALDKSGWNKSRAAKDLGISRKRLYTLIRKHGIGKSK